jgi:shikimate kinase
MKFNIFLLLSNFVCFASAYCSLDLLPVKKLILIGMPGVGKSTLAKHYANFYSMPYYDTDKILLEKFPDAFARSWEWFRKQENVILEELVKRDFFIISTGGGIIENDHNIKLLEDLKKEGVAIIKIDRNVDFATINTRILPNSWEILNHDRLPLYEKCANYKYDNSKKPNWFISWLKQIV